MTDDAAWLAAYYDGDEVKVVQPLGAVALASACASARGNLVGYGQSRPDAIADLANFTNVCLTDLANARDLLNHKIAGHLEVLQAAKRAQKEQDDQ